MGTGDSPVTRFTIVFDQTREALSLQQRDILVTLEESRRLMIEQERVEELLETLLGVTQPEPKTYTATY